MRVEITDPITGRDVQDLLNAPTVVEGHGDDALRIYFESEATRQAYLDVVIEQPSHHSLRAHNATVGFAREM